MKYFKNIESFLIKEEKNNREFDFNIFSIFKPFTNLLSRAFRNLKLVNIVNSYDNYLYMVYMEYLSRKQNMPLGELESSKIEVVDSNKTAKIKMEYEGEGYPGNFFKEPDAGTNGGAAPETNQPSHETETPTNNSLNNIIDDYSNVLDKTEIENFKGIVNQFLEKEDYLGLKKMKREEYETAYTIDAEKLETLKKDLSAYTKQKNTLMKHSMAKKEDSIEYNNYKTLLNKYTAKIQEINKKIKTFTLKTAQHKWYILQLEKVIKHIDDSRKTTNESKDWKRNAVYDIQWKEEDIVKIGNLVNPFQVEGYHLRADGIISVSKNQEQTKHKWNTLLNKLYQKWYFTFDVRNLKTLTPNMTTLKGDKHFNFKKEIMYSTMVMEQLFKYVKLYSYPFKYLNEDKSKYYILLSKNNVFLFKKALFDNYNLCCFQFLSVLRPDQEKGTLIIDKLLNSHDNKLTIRMEEKEFKIYKEMDNYPLLFVKNGMLYTTEDFKYFDKMSLEHCSIYSIHDETFRKIVKNSAVDYHDKIPTEETYNKIKQMTL